MIDGTPSGTDRAGTPGEPESPRVRSVQTRAYVAATVLGGIGALVMMVMEARVVEVGVLEVLVWAALAALLFGSAAYRWWRAGRPRRVAADVGDEHVAWAVDGSRSQVDAIRWLRRVYPGLDLKDAADLVRRHRSARGRRSRQREQSR